MHHIKRKKKASKDETPPVVYRIPSTHDSPIFKEKTELCRECYHHVRDHGRVACKKVPGCPGSTYFCIRCRRTCIYCLKHVKKGDNGDKDDSKKDENDAKSGKGKNGNKSHGSCIKRAVEPVGKSSK